MNCIITSSQETTIYKNIQSIVLPAFSGQMQVLPNHAEAFVLLQKGNISLQESNKQKNIQIDSGECYVKDNIITIVL